MRVIIYQIERESRANSGFSSSPASRTRICKYQVSKQSMTAEAADSWKKLHNPENASEMNPAQVFRHLSLFTMYTN